ncbi:MULTISPECIES: hypothetical protein [Enterobacteriaceae]|uniref:hypothetical protein n=1 Tax=Enterobacteriaceae TaxID=543 RepID=UPI0004A819F5|nr:MULTISPECIES: hypothetical protein [Klebsiella]ELP5713235.1 hypothetical protein [Enterobacter asburiae]EKQ6538730.1 hypothetical protein [Klebsiella michiganensis]ELQ7986704.1 hypothetical protein [Klebsiella michiganensis]MBZ7125662.1 hypothetical protein [Klebsiella grimontii]MBZ7913292.1 hypothetical protein [Klebsiella michiganensis]
MNLFIVVLSVVLGCYAIFDSLISYKRGVFKEYRKMAPYIYHYKGDKSFIPQLLGNGIIGILLIGFAIWFWFKIS